MTSPGCKGCTERQMGCHSICERYIEWKRLREEEINAMHNDMAIRSTIYEVTKAHTYKSLYRKNRK